MIAHVHLLPDHFDPADLQGGVAVIIDVLRASTTIVELLNNGATRVLPCEAVEEAHDLATRQQSPPLLGGERAGELIPGFDLDNSPRLCTADKVANRTIVFTTTNGTRALQRSVRADRVIIGAFTNRGAVLASLQNEARTVHLVCAGTDRQPTAEDVLLAGVLANSLLESRDKLEEAPLATQLAILFARERGGSGDEILATLRGSIGGRNLQRLGFDADIEFAAQCDVRTLLPEWSRDNGAISA
ncbi:MAG: 2-phosphosulfolactate phosphatase [Planctomycetaceae bacterium]